MRPGYANFAVATRPLKLVLIENPGADDSINHLGAEVESVDEVRVEHDRVTANAAKSDKGCCAPQLSSDKKLGSCDCDGVAGARRTRNSHRDAFNRDALANCTR